MRRGVPLTPEAIDYIQIIKHDPCCYCGARPVETDHIIPVADGGSGDWDNLTPACRSCNGTKHSKSLLNFLLSAA